MSYEAWGEPDDEYISYDAAIDAGWLWPEEADDLREQLFAASWTRMVFLSCLLVSKDVQSVAFETMRAAMALSEIQPEHCPSHAKPGGDNAD